MNQSLSDKISFGKYLGFVLFCVDSALQIISEKLLERNHCNIIGRIYWKVSYGLKECFQVVGVVLRDSLNM